MIQDVALLPLIMRWAHILSAIVAVGGTFFVRFVLMPAADATLSEEAHSNLRPALMGRWQKVVHTCILLFLVSGLYNYLVITRFEHAGQPLYHALFGTKFLLAILVFALAIALTSKRQTSLHVKAKSFLALLVLLATAVVLISGIMRALPDAPKQAGNTPTDAPIISIE